jgi:hypothetical protein
VCVCVCTTRTHAYTHKLTYVYIHKYDAGIMVTKKRTSGVYVCMHMCVHAVCLLILLLCMYTRLCMCVSMDVVCLSPGASQKQRFCAYVYASVYVHVYVCMYVYIYVYIYTYIFSPGASQKQRFCARYRV